MTKVAADKFADEVTKELRKYADEDVPDAIEKAQDVSGKAGLKTLRSESKAKFGGTGKYASGWTITKEGDRVTKSTVIHNVHPGLPHLLENGHALRNGGRWKGVQHIKPVEEEIIREYEKELENDLQGNR